jgi:hypothetical protein
MKWHNAFKHGAFAMGVDGGCLAPFGGAALVIDAIKTSRTTSARRTEF